MQQRRTYRRTLGHGARTALLLACLTGRALAADPPAPAAVPSTTSVAVAPSSTAAVAGARPAAWAVPVTLAGCPNLHQVTPTMYRGAQPTAEGFRRLHDDLGIKTIICLRSAHSDAKLVAGLGLNYVAIPMKAWNAETEDVVAALRVLNDPSQGPFFVHCQHGADRTGTICAAYRVAIQGWTAEDAARELTDGGYGFHGVWQNLLRYVRHLDAARLQRQMVAPPPADD